MEIPFKNVYCINLEKRKDRWDSISKRFSDLNIKVNRFNAIDKESELIKTKYEDFKNPQICSGAYATLFSFYMLFNSLKINNIESAVIFEDDVLFHKDFKVMLKDLFNTVPKDWELIYLGCSQFFDSSNLNKKNKGEYSDYISDVTDDEKYYKPISSVSGNFSLIVKNTIYDNVLKYLLHAITNCNNTADGIFLNIFHKHNVYVPLIKLCAHDYGMSDIDGVIYTEDDCIKNGYNWRLYDKKIYK